MRNLSHRRRGRAPKQEGRFVEFPAGATLFDERHPCRHVYLLRSGQVRLSGDRGAIVDYLGKGDCFGEKALLGPAAASLTAKSLSHVEVSAFRKSELLDCMQRDRRFAAALLRRLAQRLERYEQTIQDGVVERTERRLALLLRRLLPQRPGSGWVRLLYSPSNLELARSIGSTRWRIAHFMRHFQRQGWLERRPELWVLREGLAAFLEATSKKR